MAKNLVSLDLLIIHAISLLLIVMITLLHLLILSPAVSCVDQQSPSLQPPQGFFIEEKTRLGSIPPSCHNKCNECHPCTALQVPTLPSHDRVQPGPSRTKPMELESSPSKYANYKPLGWKCRCGNRLFNP